MRRLDSKFSIDGDEIIKTSNGESIPHDEPVFIIRARDYLALPLLSYYVELSREDGCNDYHMAGLQEMISKFSDFERRNRDRMKQPGVTRGR